MPATTPVEARFDGSDDEALLLRAARRGDHAAFGEMVKRHQSNVRRQLRFALRGDAAVADELAQDTFVLAWRSLGRFRGDARLATWLHRIAHRRFLMHARAAASRIDAVGFDEPEAMDEEGELPADAAMRIDVERAMAGLPEAQRLALFHCFQLDLSHQEAAAVLGWPVGTLKSHVARGKAVLRERLAAWAPAIEATP
jgi:RNA polymerase sigma factor (sigma-70 family)